MLSAETQQLITFIIALASFIGVLAAPILGGLVRSWELKHQAKSDSEAKWIGFLQLALANLQAVNNSANANPYLISSFILSIDDKQMQRIAEDKNLNTDQKLEQAIIRFGQLIREELQKN